MMLPRLDQCVKWYTLDIEAWWVNYAAASRAPADVVSAGITLARALARWRVSLTGRT